MESTPDQRISSAVKQAVENGMNPLDSSKFERWEDQVGVDRIINRRVLELEPLPTPAQVLGELPLSPYAQDIVAESRDEIRGCLNGDDDRLLVIVGPCSVHDPAAALDYASRLADLRAKLEGELLIVFTEYVYEVAVPKALLPEEYKKALEEPAIVLPAWDPMGALA